LVAARRKERVESLALYVRRHAGAVVRKADLDVVVTARPRRDRYRARLAAGEGVVDRIEEEVGQDLAIGAGIAVDQEAFGHGDGELDRGALEHRLEARDDLVGGLAQRELAALGMGAVDGDLLEGLDQLAGAVQIGYQLLRGIARGPHELFQLGAA